jgi:hypothetical protein
MVRAPTRGRWQHSNVVRYQLAFPFKNGRSVPDDRSETRLRAERVLLSDILLPRFQRSFVWSRKQVIDLLDSVGRNHDPAEDGPATTASTGEDDGGGPVMSLSNIRNLRPLSEPLLFRSRKVVLRPDDQQPCSGDHERDVHDHPDRCDVEPHVLACDQQDRPGHLGNAANRSEDHTVDTDRSMVPAGPNRLHVAADVDYSSNRRDHQPLCADCAIVLIPLRRPIVSGVTVNGTKMQGRARPPYDADALDALVSFASDDAFASRPWLT